MNEPRDHAFRHLLIRNGIVWIALLILLTLTLVLAYVPLGAFNGPVSLLIAGVKTLLVLAIYMELASGRPLVRLIAFLPLVFVTILFTLTLADVLSRA